VADVRCHDRAERSFRTKSGGLVILLPYLVEIGFGRMIARGALPDSTMIPAAHAMRSSLALKGSGSARHRPVVNEVFDGGLALFAGSSPNAISQRSSI
jgi:hypothetical protein